MVFVSRAKELAEAKTDVLNVVNALNNIKDESKEKRRAVVFYLDKGTGFLGDLEKILFMKFLRIKERVLL